MSRAGGAGAPFELVFTPDSTAWPVRWPERLMLKPVFGVFRGETRDYVPERTCQMDKSDFADFAPEYEGLYTCSKCGEETAVLACVNEGGDMEWMKPRFCGFCGAKVVEVVDE